MDDEWDLHAVVRSCNNTSTDATAASNTNNTTTTNDEQEDHDDDFDVTGTIACKNVKKHFSYSTSSENPSEGLEEVYKEGCSQPVITTTTTMSVSVSDEPLHEMLNASDSIYTETPSRKRYIYGMHIISTK